MSYAMNVSEQIRLHQRHIKDLERSIIKDPKDSAFYQSIIEEEKASIALLTE